MLGILNRISDQSYTEQVVCSFSLERSWGSAPTSIPMTYFSITLQCLYYLLRRSCYKCAYVNLHSGWMMWNFLVSGLASGCTLVLYGKMLFDPLKLPSHPVSDGSPLRDPAYLWDLVDQVGITIFGTSAKYIDQLSVSEAISSGACLNASRTRIEKV